MSRSEDLYKRAQEAIPGGVNSPVRAYGAVGGTPRFIARASGSHITDVDGNEYVDYVQSWGASILGHAHPRVIEAVERAVRGGSSFGAPTEGEVLLAERIREMMPSIEKVRLVSSGTEATMSAVRLARGATGRDKVIKFAGCYHGHADALLASAGSGVATFALPGSPGVPAAATRDTIVVEFNDLAAVQAAFDAAAKAIACVIVEPVAANMGVVPPAAGFLEGLRALCDGNGALLIFDEVITGFRLGPGGAQERFGVMPDLTCLGKIIGGGFPIGAFGGRDDVMDQLSPAGSVYQAGTLSGNPVATAAGLAVLETLAEDPPYERMERRAEMIGASLADSAHAQGLLVSVNREASLFSIFFGTAPVTDYKSAKKQDTAAYARFFHAMLEARVFLPPSAFEAWFLTASHDDADLEQTTESARTAFQHSA